MSVPPPATRDELRIAIIDDHDIVHAGVATWCAQADPPITVVGVYTKVEAFLTENPTSTTTIDAVLLDLELLTRRPDFDAVQQISAAGHRVIVYSHIEHPEVILRCLDLGAVSYLSKSEGRQHLIDAIYAARSDEPYVGPNMAAAMYNNDDKGRPNLSLREIEILKAWFQTENKDLVARRLHIEPTTVRTHLQRVRVKYAASGRPAPTKASLLARRPGRHHQHRGPLGQTDSGTTHGVPSTPA
jgi:DNA-binding NarL/FixJ family response regulator